MTPPRFLIPAISNLAEASRLLERLPQYARIDRVEILNRVAKAVAKTFGEVSRESRVFERAARVVEKARGFYDVGRIRNLAQRLRRAPDLGPRLFFAGQIPFFQSRSASCPLEPWREPDVRAYRKNVFPDEWDYEACRYELGQNRGALMADAGCFSGLFLAASSRASRVLLIEDRPLTAFTLPLILPLMPHHRRPFEFARQAKNLVKRGEPTEPFLGHIPSPYQSAFAHHISRLRRNRALTHQTEVVLDRFFANRGMLLGIQNLFDYARDRIKFGDVALLHGPIFGNDLPLLVHAALGLFAEPIRTVYFSSLTEQVRVPRGTPQETEPFLELFRQADPAGLFILSSEDYGVRPDLKGEDGFAYHIRKTALAADSLEGSPTLRDFFDGIVQRRAKYLSGKL